MESGGDGAGVQGRGSCGVSPPPFVEETVPPSDGAVCTSCGVSPPPGAVGAVWGSYGVSPPPMVDILLTDACETEGSAGMTVHGRKERCTAAGDLVALKPSLDDQIAADAGKHRLENSSPEIVPEMTMCEMSLGLTEQRLLAQLG